MRCRDLVVNFLDILGHQPEFGTMLTGQFRVLKKVDPQAVLFDDAERLVSSTFIMPDLKTQAIHEHFHTIGDIDVEDIGN